MLDERPRTEIPLDGSGGLNAEGYQHLTAIGELMFDAEFFGWPTKTFQTGDDCYVCIAFVKNKLVVWGGNVRQIGTILAGKEKE